MSQGHKSQNPIPKIYPPFIYNQTILKTHTADLSAPVRLVSARHFRFRNALPFQTGNVTKQQSIGVHFRWLVTNKYSKTRPRAKKFLNRWAIHRCYFGQKSCDFWITWCKSIWGPVRIEQGTTFQRNSCAFPPPLAKVISVSGGNSWVCECVTPRILQRNTTNTFQLEDQRRSKIVWWQNCYGNPLYLQLTCRETRCRVRSKLWGEELCVFAWQNFGFPSQSSIYSKHGPQRSWERWMLLWIMQSGFYDTKSKCKICFFIELVLYKIRILIAILFFPL